MLHTYGNTFERTASLKIKHALTSCYQDTKGLIHLIERSSGILEEVNQVLKAD